MEMLGRDRSYLRARRRPAAGDAGTLNIVDLFAGCGGLSLGVLEAARARGFRIDVRLAAEWDSKASAAYAKNLDVPREKLAADVFEILDGRVASTLTALERMTRRRAGRAVQLLVGGPPCQGHSSLNNVSRGNDPKNELYLRMVRAAEVLEPEAVLVENVPGIERDALGVLARARKRLEQLGYKIDAAVVRVADVGVPQLRKRHVLLAHQSRTPDVNGAIAAARVKTIRTLRWAIGDLRCDASVFDSAALLSTANKKRAAYLLKHDAYDLPDRLRPECHRTPHKYKSMYGRLRWDEPAQTITTGFGSPGQGRYLHPAEPRTLTPHEAARLQFFPDWYDFTALDSRNALAHAIGNAVPPKLAFVLAHSLLELTHGTATSTASPEPVLRIAVGRR